MANNANNDGRRVVVSDPLAANPREQQIDRSLATSGVRAPMTPSEASLSRDNGMDRALQGVEGIIAQEFEKKKDGWITEGKIAFQSGQTEDAMLANGNKYTAQGYRTLQARDGVNNWFTKESIAIEETSKRIEPGVYQAGLTKHREEALKGITDPVARKIASAAYEEMSPRLAASQAVKNNEFNRGERVKAFTSVISSTAMTSSSASKRDPGQHLALSPAPVEAVMQPSAYDRDVGIRTILGEAANQGADGQAAVAHVLRNRAIDGRWPDSIAGVALQPKQFSAWNSGAGGNDLVTKYKPGDPMYDRAAQVFDAVMTGKHVDPTGGATHYYSPAGMNKLVTDGDQTNTVPAWLKDETTKSGGNVRIGGHIFAGKSKGTGPRPSVDVPVTPGDLNVVPAQEGVAVTGVAAAGEHNEVKQLIHGYAGLSPSDKATAVSDAMRRGLETGNDSLFRDGGGVATLHQLGAKPNEIDEVLKAQLRYNAKKSNEFSVDNEKFRDDIMSAAEKGTGRDELLKRIDERHKAGILDDSNARQLAHSAADKVRSESGGKSKSKLSDPNMLDELGGLYQQIATGGDFKTLAAQGTAIANRYGANEDDVKQIVGKMFTDSQSHLNKLRHDSETAVKTKIGQDASKGTVARALANGYGLGIVSGDSIKVMNDAGQPTTVTPTEYGVMQVKDKWGKHYKDKVTSGDLSEGQASMELARSVSLELQNHGVVDKQTQAQIVGGLTKNILDDKAKGGLTPGAKGAYDFWLSLKTTPGIRPEYMAKVVEDPYVRGLLETAHLLDSGDLSKEHSLIKAHEIMNDPNRDPEDRIRKDAVWTSKLEKDLTTTLMNRTDPGFFGRMFGTDNRNDQERIIKNNKVAENYVRRRADAYHLQNPNELGEVSLEKALQDLQAHSVPVMGNLIIAQPGKELDKVMNIREFGPDSANEAINGFVRKHAATLWGKAYTEQQEGTFSKVARGVGTAITFPYAIGTGVGEAITGQEVPKGTTAREPPVAVTYNAEMGIITVDLYKDASKGQTIGSPKHFKVGVIGEEYRKEQTTPSTWDKTWNKMFKGTARVVKDVLE